MEHFNCRKPSWRRKLNYLKIYRGGQRKYVNMLARKYSGKALNNGAELKQLRITMIVF